MKKQGNQPEDRMLVLERIWKKLRKEPDERMRALIAVSEILKIALGQFGETMLVDKDSSTKIITAKTPQGPVTMRVSIGQQNKNNKDRS